MGDGITVLADKRKPRFSEFADEKPPLEGDKLKIDDILNQEVELIDFRIGRTKYSKNQSGKYITLQIRKDGMLHVVFTGSDVLISQAMKYAEHVPFLVTIKKINRYYTMT